MSRKLKIMIGLNSAWNLLNFRSGLVRRMLAEDWEVIALAPDCEYSDQVRALGCQFITLPLDTHGTNPFKDILLFWRYRCLLKDLRPDVFLGFTVKPNVFGTLAAHSLRIKVINNITGLGSVFNNNNMLCILVRFLYRVALSRSTKVFFQNQDDLELFVNTGIVDPSIATCLPGSGIDLKRFHLLPPKSNSNLITVLLLSRMLFDKGVGEYVEAAISLKPQYPNIEFALMGFLDLKNKTAISRSQMDAWIAMGSVVYWGVSDDVRSAIAQADVVVLPSYREGTPRVLLEACAMGRPVITTSSVGCKNVVDDGVTGFLCEPKNAEDLARAIRNFLSLSQYQRFNMGLEGRRKMELEFDEEIVVRHYLEVIRTMRQVEY